MIAEALGTIKREPRSCVTGNEDRAFRKAFHFVIGMHRVYTARANPTVGYRSLVLDQYVVVSARFADVRVVAPSLPTCGKLPALHQPAVSLEHPLPILFPEGV